MPLAPLEADAAQDLATQRLLDALAPDFLELVRWDWQLGIFFYPKDHPILGMPDCHVQGCDLGFEDTGPFCSGCRIRWKESDLSLEDYLRTAERNDLRYTRQELCRLPGCERPWSSPSAALCRTHQYQRTQTLKVTMEEFLAHPKAKPLPGFGSCQVAACHRRRARGGTIYCDGHHQRLESARKRGLVGTDEELWRQTAASVPMNREVSMRGLPRRLVAELLYCLQARTAQGFKTYEHWLRGLCDQLRTLRCESLTSLGDVSIAKMRSHAPTLVPTMRRALHRLLTTPEMESRRDVWDLAVFGHTGTLNFTGIHQTALREAMRIWAADELPRHRGKAVANHMQRYVSSVAELSESLRVQRDDGGHIVALLDRSDIVAFCNRLAFLVGAGTVSSGRRLSTIRCTRKVLARLRTLGLTGKGRILEGLRSDFALGPEDTPDEPEDSEAGKDLPDEVLQQLCDNLDLLQQMSGREVRVCVELLIDTGRRPDEICQLPWDCVARDADGSLVLLYDNHKALRLGRRLPIAKATAAVITAQQDRVRERYPDTPVADLKLLPTSRANREGVKPIAGIWDQHRNWVMALPEFVVPVEVEEDGQPVTRMLPFSKARIFPYAYRHSYAQRHADAGVAPDVLKELMDHRQLITTQSYYRVGQERRREAIDKVTLLQFDRNGGRVWRKAKGLLDSEHVRREIGEVATAYGICREPSNVAAGGQSCPLRFRCLGCEHFSTDVSYLPDLEAHLADLLRSRERLMSAFEADDWARSEAMPSQEEIGRVRRLISRVKADLDDLTAEERAQIEQAVAVVRRSRTVMLGMPRVGQPLPDVRPRRSV